MVTLELFSLTDELKGNFTIFIKVGGNEHSGLHLKSSELCFMAIKPSHAHHERSTEKLHSIFENCASLTV